MDKTRFKTFNILSGCGMQSDIKQKRDEALPLGESATPEAPPTALPWVGSSHTLTSVTVAWLVWGEVDAVQFCGERSHKTYECSITVMHQSPKLQNVGSIPTIHA